MKLSNLNEWLSLAANFGVLLGIIFLAIEIEQNNEHLAAQSRFNRLSVAGESATILAESPDLADFIIRVNNGEDLTPEEDLRLNSFLRRTLTNMEWGFFELPREELPLELWRLLYTEPARRRAWDTYKGTFAPEFVQYIEEQVYGQ